MHKLIITVAFAALLGAGCLPQDPNLQYQVVRADGSTYWATAQEIEANNLGGQAIAFCVKNNGESFVEVDYNTAKQIALPCCPIIAGRISGGGAAKFEC